MAPIALARAPVGAVAARFSLERADELVARTRRWAFGLTAGSVVVMAVLMSAAIQHVVDRPVRQFVDAIARIRGGDTSATVPATSRDEFGVMARHFNEMMARVNQFSDELQLRVKEATAELDQRYHEVQRLNGQLFEAQRTLSHAERLAVSGRILAELAHEVGTPLHSVSGHLELLRRDVQTAGAREDVLRRVAVIEAQLARVTAIIAQLLDLTRRSASAPVCADVNRLVRDTAELVRPGVSAAGLVLRLETEPMLPAVRGQAAQLQQVFLNLLTNAIDATPRGGRIAVATRSGDGATLVVEVRDTGSGIAPGDRRQIFEPFFSTKPPGRGTGLGLFISAEIVRDHKGRIEVETEPGQGSAFRVILPTAREERSG
jgi:signal transduction histidine kinase